MHPKHDRNPTNLVFAKCDLDMILPYYFFETHKQLSPIYN